MASAGCVFATHPVEAYMSNVVTRYFKDCATDIKERALQRNYLKLKGLEQPILMICEFS
jgi:hypothetical protein